MGHGRARPRKRRDWGRVRNSKSGPSGFRGHRGGWGAYVVSSAQLGLVREFPLEGTWGVGFWGRVYFLSFSFSRRERYRFGSVR